MAMLKKMTYSVDIVFCIDCTESMDNILNIVKRNALNFYDDLVKAMSEEEKIVDTLRVKVIAFRDYRAYDDEQKKGVHRNEPMLISDFFTLPDEARKLEVSVNSLIPAGGGDDPEDALEALAYAIRSDWNTNGAKVRHVIVLWTDQAPHPIGFGKYTSKYPKGMAKDFDELTAWWGDETAPGYMPAQQDKRLVLFAPAEGQWRNMPWEFVIHHTSRAGDHLSQVDYKHIINAIKNSI